MSRTEEDILSRIDITIMRHSTLRTCPTSYSEVCDTFRPRLTCARRTDSGRKRFIHFLVPSPVRSRFVAEHVAEGRPPCIEHGLRQGGLSKSGGVHIAHRDVIELPNDAGRELVVKITARMDDARVDVGSLTAFTGSLRGRELVRQLPQMSRIFDLLPIGQHRELLKAQVDANTAIHRPTIRLRDFDDDVQEPMAACITGEVGSVLDFAFRQRSRVKHPKRVSSETKGLTLALEVTALQWHPAQRPPTAPPQERQVLLAAGLGVLLAHRVDGAGVQRKLFAASGGQPIEIEAGRPALVPFQRVLLGVVAEIPDEIAGARLPVQQTGEGLDAVSIDQQHTPKIVPSRRVRKALKLAETLSSAILLHRYCASFDPQN